VSKHSFERVVWALVLMACGEPAAVGHDAATTSDAHVLANDAAMLDAARPDAPMADAGHAASTDTGALDAGMPAPCPADALLCDDFEAAALASRWTLDASDGEATIDTMSAHGHGALHVHVASHGGARALVQAHSFFPVAGNSVYARAFVRLASPAPTVHVGMVDGSGESIEVRLGLGPALLPNYSGPGVEFGSWAADPPLMPVDTWTCLEWALLDDPGTDHDRLLYWIDGVEETNHEIDGTGTDVWRMPTLDQVELGLIMYHDDEAGMGHDIWYDDVVFATHRVGCH